jgi:hypothetical protein
MQGMQAAFEGELTMLLDIGWHLNVPPTKKLTKTVH